MARMGKEQYNPQMIIIPRLSFDLFIKTGSSNVICKLNWKLFLENTHW